MSKRKKLHIDRIILVLIIIMAITMLIAKMRSSIQTSKVQENEVFSNAIKIDLSENQNDENNLTKVQKDETKQNDNTNAVQLVQNNFTQNNIETKKETINSDKKLSTNGLTVLMYHFFYDKNVENGQDDNWMEISDFEEQMKYLSENNFYFPTWKEVEEYIDGKTELPEKSLVITMDDGDPSFFKLALPIIKKYKIKATEFIITSWYADLANENKSEYMNYESHSDSMHQGGKNGKGVMMSWSNEKILTDLKTSQDKLGGATVFCYPFGQYVANSEELVKQSGFKLAFTTKSGRVKKGSDKFALPRIRMFKGVKFSSFKAVVNY